MANKAINMIKEANLNQLREVMKREKTATKPQLAALTGISLVTVNSLMKELEGAGEVQEDTIVQPQLGRPAVMYKYNAQYRLALIIFMHEKDKKDITNFTICNLYGEIMDSFNKELGVMMKESFDSTIAELLIEYPNIKIIGFGIPGVEVDGQLLLSDYAGLQDAELCSYIKNKFHLPVFIENDINAAIAGYCHAHFNKRDRCVIGLYFPSKYAPGAGIFLNGNLMKGCKGLAGEIKFLPFGIDWENFDHQEDKVNEVVVKVMKTFMCLYNPDTIVIYQDDTEYDYVTKLRHQCPSSMEQLLMPDIIISSELNNDFEKGMICLALEQLDISQGI